jgi:hypothetical protein
VGEKMAAVMADRGMQVPRREMELALAYAIRHGRPGKTAAATATQRS